MISRVITYPSTVEKSSNTTVVIIDASVQDVAEITAFCQSSNKEYDIYLYKHDLDDVQWLSIIAQLSDVVLVNQQTKVTIENVDQIALFGLAQQLNTPLAYFQQVDNA